MVARGAKAEGYSHGRWQQQQAGAPHATPALINISPRPTSPIALAQYLIFKITDDKKFIEIEHKVRVRVSVRGYQANPNANPHPNQGEKGASFADFTSKLPDDECRYAVLDVEITTSSGAATNKLIFIAWCA